MTTLQRKLLTFLKKQSKPISIGTIQKDTQFKTCDRRELSQALRALAAGRSVFKSLENGKPCYSTDPTSGEGPNGNQSFLLMMPGMVNMDVAYDDGIDFEEEESEESVSTDSSASATKYYKGISITYNKEKKAKGDGYTFLVPDSFSIGEENGRDFVAWYPSKDDPKEHSSGIIRIYPGQTQETMEEGLVLETLQSYPPMCSAFQEHGMEALRAQNTPLSALMRNYVHYPLDAKHTGGGCMFNRTPNYYTYIVTLFINDHFKQFRFDVEGASMRSETQIKKTLLALIDGIVPDVPFTLEKPLNDQFYKDQKLTKKFVQNWSQKFDLQLGRQRAVMSIRMKTVEAMIQSQSMNGGVDRDEIMERIRNAAREMAEVAERLLSEAAELIEYFSNVDEENMVLLDLYNEIIAYCESNNEVTINIGDDDKVVEKVSSLATLKKRFLTDQVARLKERSDIVKYEEIQQKIDRCSTVEDIEKIEKMLLELGTYRDSAELKKKCVDKKLEIKNSKAYAEAVAQMQKAKTSAAMKKAVDALKKLGSYKDCKELCAQATAQMNSLAEEEQRKKDEEQASALKNRVAMQSASERICAHGEGFAIVTLDGCVKTYNFPPEMASVISRWRNIKSIRCSLPEPSMNTAFAVGLKYDGTVVSCGHIDGDRACINTFSWRNIVQVAVGYRHILGLRGDGTVVAAGANYNSEGNVSSWRNVKKIAAGIQISIGLQNDGQVVITGNTKARITCKNVVDVSCWKGIGPSVITADGKVYSASDFSPCEQEHKEWGKMLALGRYFDEPMYCSGIASDLTAKVHYDSRQLSDDFEVTVSKWKDVVAVDSWRNGILAVTKDGQLKIASKYAIPSDIQNEKLFNDFMTIEEDRKKAIEEAEKKRVARIKAEIEDLEKQMLEVKGLFAGIKKKSLQKKIDALKDQI